MTTGSIQRLLIREIRLEKKILPSFLKIRIKRRTRHHRRDIASEIAGADFISVVIFVRKSRTTTGTFRLYTYQMLRRLNRDLAHITRLDRTLPFHQYLEVSTLSLHCRPRFPVAAISGHQPALSRSMLN